MPSLIDHGLRNGKKAKKGKSKKADPKPKGKRGRPTLYIEALGEAICDRLADGESLHSICRDPKMPPRWTIRSWAEDESHPFARQYAHAREIGYHQLAEEILEIADDATNDYIERMTESGSQVIVDHDHISRSRLRVETRKWILSKQLPKIYGDKLTLKGDKDSPLTAKLTVENIVAEVSGVRARIPERQGGAE
jgi:hypothetical protein